MRILIVEDDDALSEILLGHCQDRGHSVDRVRHAGECLGAIETRNPDCVFLDVRLGDGNGLDLLPELKMRRRDLRSNMFGWIQTSATCFPGSRKRATGK